VEALSRKRPTVWLDITMHVFQGLTGLLVAFLFFFSVHPAVDSNWLVIILNPLALVYAAWMWYCHKKGRKNVLAYVNLVVMTGFIVTMCVCPQSFNPAMWLVVLALLVRALLQAHFVYHGNLKIENLKS
jgi:hypothetical protein